MPDIRTVTCIGTCAMISLWRVGDRPFSTPSDTGVFCGSLLGNDAVIVATELGRIGLRSGCCLLNPTNEDVIAVNVSVSPQRVIVIDKEIGKLTRSLCLETRNGVRHWLFSRVCHPVTPIPNLEDGLVYVDYYPELAKYLSGEENVALLNERRVFANLSSVSDLSSVPPLPFSPFAVQLSVSPERSTQEVCDCAHQLLTRLRSHMVFVTMGQGGAVAASASGVFYLPPSTILPASMLGPGSLFSSNVIHGITQGYGVHELLEFSMRQTATRLQSWQLDEGYCS